MSLFQSLVPKEFKPFLKRVSPAAFKVVDWKRALKTSSQLSKRYLTGEGQEDLQDGLSGHLPEGVQFGRGTQGLLSLVNPEEVGEKILGVYFAQLQAEEGCFLDLRAQCWSGEGETVYWNPSNLWVTFSSEFRQGLQQVYWGYYQNQSEFMDQGVLQMGLVTPDMDNEQKAEIKKLLIDHVGSENNEAMRFSLDKFEASFDQFFLTLKSRGQRLPADFLFLGVYLVLLYSTLESLGVPLNVKRAYLANHSTDPGGA
jgi:hypothetical protein